MLTPAPLPPLDAKAAARSALLAARLRARLAAAGGWLPFSDFMEAALYEPALGYYMAEQPIFGAGGDYVTAPELSPLFARCLATSVAAVLAQQGGGDVVEFGAGSGQLAADLLATLAGRGMAPRRYRVVEPSPALAERQRRALAAVTAPGTQLEWLAEPPTQPWQGVALANEVIDALPVERFRVVPGGCEVLGVIAAGDGFAWRAAPAPAALAEAVAALDARLPAGFVSELRPALGAWLARSLAGLQCGAALFVDYGLPRAQYYHPSRDGGTLTAFRQHRQVDDVLAAPGAQDLTAWVDFSALAEAGVAAGFEVAGFATQAHWLLSSGLERELARLVAGADGRAEVALRRSAALLTHPEEMGERFKVLALARGLREPVPGFAFRDLSASL